MSSIKHLVYAVIRFLREQSQMDAYTSDEQESLEGRHLFSVFICVMIIKTKNTISLTLWSVVSKSEYLDFSRRETLWCNVFILWGFFFFPVNKIRGLLFLYWTTIMCQNYAIHLIGKFLSMVTVKFVIIPIQQRSKRNTID